MIRFILLAAITLLFHTAMRAQTPTERWAGLSTRLLETVCQGGNYQPQVDSLAAVSLEELSGALNNDEARLTFWINVYNSFIQILLTNEPSLFNDRGRFFKKEQVKVAGRMLSFDQIEHGIIRGSKWKLGLGIIPKPFPPKFERKLRVRHTDPRVHLALNCGAKSCPPVAAYEYGRLNEQLDESCRRYLQQTTRYDAAANEVAISPLFSWFRGDWGCKKDVRKFLKKYGAIPPDSKPTINYGDYDWTLHTGNYIDL